MNLLNNWSNISSASLFSLRLHIFSSDALTLFSKLIPLESFLCGSTLRKKKEGGDGVRGRNRRKKKKAVLILLALCVCVCEMLGCHIWVRPPSLAQASSCDFFREYSLTSAWVRRRWVWRISCLAGVAR